MGNSESKDDASQTSNSPSPRTERRSAGGGSVSRRRDGQHHTRHSSHATRSQNPATNLLSSSASTTTSHTTSASATTRPRSITAGESHQHHLQVRDLLPASYRSADSDAMGANESKPHPRPPSRASTLPPPSHDTPPPANETSESVPEERALPEPVAEPVEVPSAPPLSQQDVFADKGEIQSGSYIESPFSAPISNYSRPPRLPLPIEEEVLAPGSPILSPEDIKNISTPLDPEQVEGSIPSKTLSSTTVDEDELVDNDAFAPEASQYEVRVPTKLEWNGDGDKVFITGTFCSWERKIKLHKNKDGPGFSATVNLRPGTHHIKFLVDGEMVTSPELPTTVDWINILVNYIEIVAPMPPAAEEEKQPPAPAAPMPIPGAAVTAGQATAPNDPAAQTRTPGMDPQTSSPEAGLLATIERVNREYEQSIDSDPGSRTDRDHAKANATAPSANKPKPRPTPALKQNIPRPIYTNRIPEFLVDLDNFNNPDGEERYARAQKVSKVLPDPPTLPSFLNKSILNGTTPHKDDASVLIMPNHTVLNHLATSSIKNGVLATSGTTRYKRKFLTTIMYKPTSDDG